MAGMHIQRGTQLHYLVQQFLSLSYTHAVSRFIASIICVHVYCVNASCALHVKHVPFIQVCLSFQNSIAQHAFESRVNTHGL